VKTLIAIVIASVFVGPAQAQNPAAPAPAPGSIAAREAALGPLPTQTNLGLPIEPGADIDLSMREKARAKGNDGLVLEVLDYMANLVRMNGWRCDSVSSFRPYLFSMKAGTS
jgi:hypothetical protein